MARNLIKPRLKAGSDSSEPEEFLKDFLKTYQKRDMKNLIQTL